METQINTLWIYGDSFSLTFKQHFETTNDWPQKYKNFKNGIIPKHFSEIIAEKLGMNINTYAQGGISNINIFDRFVGTFPLIQEDDIVIINWTALNRFPIATNENNFTDIIPFVGHPKQNDNVSLNTTNEIAVNRDSYSIYYCEVINYCRIINHILKNNKVIHWTWIDDKKELITLDRPDFRKIFYDYLVPFKQYETITEETKGFFVDQHYSEKGHIDLANDLLMFLKK